jgi:hypothetical protein
VLFRLGKRGCARDQSRIEPRAHAMEMIRYSLIVEAAGFTAAVVLPGAGLAHWRPLPAFAATIGAFGLLALWRAVANAASLNGDFLAYVSVGDCGCLLAGGMAPRLAALTGVPRRLRALPAVAGGGAGFTRTGGFRGCWIIPALTALLAACGESSGGSSEPSPSVAGLHVVADVPLGGSTARLDYQSLDDANHRLYIARWRWWTPERRA